MCGFAGFISDKSIRESHEILRNMSIAIEHRGPDDHGFWSSNSEKVHMCFRRLAIVDLSESGHQPMQSFSRRYVLSFNGEIYNHLDLKKKLDTEFPNILWKGSSDTEVLLNMIECYGLSIALKKSIGMFALVLFDEKLNKIYLAQDRFGEKPLYYGWIGSSFVYGSDLASIKEFPDFERIICKQALRLYLNYSYVPAPWSIYKDIFKIKPGQIITLSINTNIRNTSSEYYWKKDEEVVAAKKNLYHSYEEGVNDLDNALQKSINHQMISEVPIGAFLSGGIDSSLAVSLMQENSMSPVKTFTIGFKDKAYDESRFAKSIAKYLHTDHTEAILEPQDMINVIPSIPSVYSEPFADASQIPVFFLSKITSSKVTVALSGDGGDELFAGYNHYFWRKKIWNKVAWAPFLARNFLGKSLESIPVSFFDRLDFLFFSGKQNQSGVLSSEKIMGIAKRLQSIDSEESVYSSLCAAWDDVNMILSDAYRTQSNETLRFSPLQDLSPVENMMSWDLDSYLPGDILTKVDRASMACSLEVRSPFLDASVAKVAWRMPEYFLISGLEGKQPLRTLLNRRIPRTLFERPKAGFSIPLPEWLRTSLNEWASDLLDEESLLAEGIFDASAISQLWHEHLNGSANHAIKLWNIIMFRLWMSENR